ncbi:ALP1-like protein [Tanacetum coccineum]|uniref:ALP1-like protein n=1 Tax=Tanacetum coccineum TaxID=301880 RepID=A0ABQ5CEM4_9ASTR
MMSDSSGGGLSGLDDIDDLEMIMQQVQAEREQEEEVERVRHLNYIYRKRLDAEERLMADYFGPNPKYPEYYFRKRYRMSRKLFLEIVSALIVCTGNEEIAQKHGMGNLLEVIKKYPTIMLEVVASYDLWIWHAFFGVSGANNDLTVLNNSPLFDDLHDDIALVAPFECNGVTFEKGYYLADGIYPQWSSFVKSFTVANSEKNALFKRKQESARKDVERAFGVLQGCWHIICQLARAWTVNKLRRVKDAGAVLRCDPLIALKLLKTNDDLCSFVKACYDNNLKIDLFTEHNSYDIMEKIYEELHLKKPVSHVDSDSDVETNHPLDDVACRN